MKRKSGLLAWIEDTFTDEEDPNEPFYDPVHIGGAVVITLTAIGCLYWLLWTLLVYEGGLFVKLQAAALLVFTKTTLKDLGYEGYPYAMGQFEGWIGNVIALALTVAVVAALRHAYLHAARAHKAKV
ncbi:MAG: hypothetical protein HY078_10390 [Elusimicrobia bacterium]|nr:hypothetical protein [Elusimicrobiota bacterium]